MEIQKLNKELKYLYLLEMYDDSRTEIFYKIGITGKGVKIRYSFKDRFVYNYKIIFEIPMLREDAIYLEKLVKYNNRKHLYIPKIYFGGAKTECFSSIPEVSLREKQKEAFEIDTTIDLSKYKLYYLDLKGTKNYELLTKNNFSHKILKNNPTYKHKLINALENININIVYDFFQVLTPKIFKEYIKGNGYTKRVNPIKDEFKKEHIMYLDNFSGLNNAYDLSDNEFAKFQLKELLKDNPQVKTIIFGFVEKELIEKRLEVKLENLPFGELKDKFKEDKIK